MNNEGSIDPRYHLPVSEAPVIDRKIPKSAFEFDNQFEDGVISNAKIKNLNFSQASGGTINLGGAGNGNGILKVFDSSGSQVVTADNTGITIKDNNGTTIIDGSGLVSQANFNYFAAYNNSTQTTSGTTFINLVDGTMGPIVLARDTICFIYANVVAYNDSCLGNAYNYTEFQIYDSFSGTNTFNFFVTGMSHTYVDFDTGTGLINSVSYKVRDQQTHYGAIINLLAGTHTLNLQMRTITAGESNVDSFDTGCIQFGN